MQRGGNFLYEKKLPRDTETNPNLLYAYIQSKKAMLKSVETLKRKGRTSAVGGGMELKLFFHF